MPDLLTPKLRVPLGMEGDHLSCVEQDSDDEVTQCITAVVRTTPGTRPDDAHMGLPDFVFRQDGVDLEQVKSILLKYEPRASVMTDQELVDLIDTVGLDVQTTIEEVHNA